MLRVYGRHNSSNSAKVFWLLDELGEAYELIATGRGFAATDTAEFRALNPFGKVPVVEDGATVVWESNAVLRYLAGRAANPLWPQDAAGRSAADRWMDWVSMSFNPALTRLRKARSAGAAETPEDLAAVIRGAEALDQWLADRAYLCGAGLTLADIVAAPAVYRWFRLPESARPLLHLSAYHARLATHPGFQRHIRDALT
jgi:glutathione S-transferase